MAGPRLPLLLTLTLLLTPLSLTDTSTQTSFGENSTAETVRSAKHNDEGGGDGDGGDGGVEGEVRGQKGVVGSAATALWEKLRPFVDGEYTDGTDGLQARIRRRLLRVAEEEVSLYSRSAAYTWPDDHSRAANQTKPASAAGDEDNSHDDDVGSDMEYDIPRDVGDEDPCGYDDYCDNDDDVRRSKRDHPQERPQAYDMRGAVLLERVEGMVSLGAWVSLGVHVTQWHGRLILAVLDTSMRVTLHAVSPGTLEVASSPSFPALHSCSFAVVPVDRLLLACISPNGSSVVHGVQQAAGREVAVYKVSEETFGAGKLAVKHHQSVEAKNPVDLELWSRGQENYLLIANAEEAVEAYSPWGEELTNRTTYHTSSLLYHWNDHYFDGLQQRVLPGTNPHAVTHFTIGRQHFVAMANFQNNKGQHNVDSYVFQYSLEEEHFVLFQRLATRGARHFASFTLGRHPFADTFLVVANFCEDNIGGACDTFTRSSIYRYAQRKFVLFQEVATAYAVQWQAVQVEDTVLLAVAQLVEGVKLFQYDGWRFVAAPVQHYEGRFGPGVTGLAAARWNGTYVLAVSNREPENSPAQSPDVFNLTFRENTWLQKVHLEHHAWCEAAREEVARVGDLSSLIQQVHSAPTNGQPHVFTQYSIIRGHLTVQRNSSVTQVFERRTGSRMPVMLDSLTQTLVAMEQEVQRAATRLSHAISLTSPYPWPAELHLAHLSAGWASVEHVEALQLNQRRVSFEDAVTLDEAGAQHLAGLSLAHVEIQAPARITMLAGVPFSSYVTLSGRHTLHGQVTILANVSAAGLLALSVDGVHITRKSVLTANEYQYLKGLLTCQHLSVDSMEVITINSIPLSPLLSTLVFRDGRHTVSGLVRVRGDLAYYGNLKINLTTHLDVENPLRTDYTGLQVITSDHQAGGLATQVMAVEGRVNGVRVPADVFLNGRQYSYNVPRAAFRNVRADLLSVTRALNSLTVSEGRLDVLLLSGDQQVTAHKMLSSLHVLRSDSPDVGTRRRRWSSESCGSSKANKPKTPKDRSEALLLSLKGVAAARHLLSYLVKAPQGILLVPGHSLHFFKALTQNVACAISSLEDDSCFKLYNILQEVEWINSTSQDGTLLTRKTVLEIISNVKRYIVKEERELKKIRLTSNDLLKIRDVTGRNTPTRQDIVILSSLISVARNHELHHLPPDILFNNCVLVCPEIRENMAVDKNLQKTCTPSITPIFKALRSMSQYSSIIRRMWHLSTRHFGMLETGVIHHLLGRLLQTVRMHKQLRKQIYAAAVCGISPEGGKQSLQVLIKYRQEVHREALNLFVSRTKREAPVANDELAETTNSPSTTESLSTGDNSTTSPSPSSFTGNLTTSTEDQTISLPSTTQTTTISNEDSTTFPSSTVNGPVISSEESTFFPFTTATNLTISGEDSSTSSFINEDTTISFEDLTEAPPSTVLLTGSNLTFTPHPPSTTEDVTIFSDSSTTSPSFTTKDSNISSEISTIPSSTPEDSTIFSEISTISSSTPEDSTISSEISTTSSSTPENSTISSEISTTSSSNTEDSTISSEISITSSSNPDDSTIFSEISTTSFFPPEDSTISSEISATSSSTTEDSTIFSEISTTSSSNTEDSSISSEISITSSSNPEDSTIFSEISTTSFFPPEDSTISSEISATSSSTTEDSTIFSEISATLFSTTEDSTISSEISTVSSSATVDSTISSEISTASSSTNEDSTIASEISTASSSTPEDSTISREISTTLFFTSEDSIISSEISTASFSSTEDSTKISGEILTSLSSTTEDNSTFSEEPSVSSSISHRPTTYSENSTTPVSITEDLTATITVREDPIPSLTFATADPATSPTSTTEDSTTSLTSSLHYATPSTSLVPLEEILARSFGSFSSGSEGETINEDSSADINNFFNALLNLTTTLHTEMATPSTSTSEEPVDEDNLGGIFDAIKNLATTTPAEETTLVTTDSSESTPNEDENGGLDDINGSENQTTTRPAEVTTLETDVSEGTMVVDSNGDSLLGAIKDLATTGSSEVQTHKTDDFIEDTTHLTTDTTENTTKVTTDPVRDTTPCIDCPVLESNSSVDTDNNILNYTTSSNATPCFECNEVTTLETDVSEGTLVGGSNGDSLLGAIKDLATTDASVDESATTVQRLLTTSEEDTTTETAVDGSTQSITTNTFEEGSHNVTTETSTAHSSSGGETTHSTKEAATPTLVSQDITCAIITESPPTDPEEPLEVMIKFSDENSAMEVRRSVTKADPMLVPLSISLNYDNCSSLSLALLQDSDHLMYLYPRLQMTSHYLFTVLQSQGNVDSTETSEYDVGLEGSMFDGFGFIIDTLKKFVLDPIKFLETLDSERLQSDFEFLDFVFSFASSSHYHYWSDRLRYRALYLERLLDVGITIVDKLKKCFESLSPVSTSVTETTTVYFVDPEEMPEIMHDLERQLVSNEELIESLTILLNFTRDVQAFNPYLNPRCPSPHTIDHEFVAYAIEAARETLDMILADELKFVSEYNSSVLANQLLQLRDAMQLCLMADKLSPETEAYLSLLYNKNGSPMARDSEKLLSVRIYYLLRATHGLVDYMNVITEEHTIKHEVSSYPPDVVPLTDWNWDGLWLAGRLEGYSISQLLEDAKLHPTLQKEYTAYFDPAFSSYSSFIAEHREKVRHLVFRAGLGTVSVQEHGVMRVVQHALWLTTTPATSLTFAAPVTVVGSVTASVINGTPADAFVTLGGQHVLPQPFVFTGSVTAAAHVLLRGEVSGVDLALLSRSVAVTSPVASQKLLQPVTFARVSAASVVFAHGRVRDVPLEDLVRLDRPAAITGIKTFTELTVRLGGTRASNLTAQFISGVNVTDLFFNSLTTNPGGPQVVTGALHLRHLVVRRNVTTHRLVYLDPLGTPHTLNLPSLASRMVPLHGDTILTGSLNFTGVVYVSALLFRDSLDRVSAAQFRDGWLLRAGDQDILGPVSFLNITIYKATVLHGATLQGVDLTRLFGATLLTTQPVTLHATFAFRGLVWAAWTMVDGLVQGWDLGTHAVLQHSSGVVFTAAKTFLGNMHVSGAITSGSRADHCPYFPIKNFTIQGQVLANNALNAGSAVMSSHEVTAEAATQYWLADTSAKVAVSTLRVVKLNYSTATKVNGEDLQDLRSDLLQKYCDTGEVQRLVGNYTFSSLEVDALYTPAINSSFINGEPGNSLQQVLFSGGTQVFTGHPTFASLHSEGSVATSEAVNNGLKGSQLCRHSQRCVVRSPKNFLQDLIILRNLTVLENSLVQGVDVSRALQSWVPQDSCGHVPGLTTITGNLIVASIPSVISVGGLVDGVEFTSRHVMTRTGRQTLTKTFLVNQPHGVALESLAGLTALDGLFNGYSLSDAWRRAFLSNASVVVKAPVVFKEIVVFKDAISLQTQDPAPLPNFGDFKHFFGDFSRLHSLSVLSERAQLGRVRENWGWRVVQELDPHLERLLPLTMGAAAPRPLTTAPLSPNHHLALLSGSGSVPVLQRDPHADRYAHSGVVLAGRCTTGLVSYASEGRNFLVTTHACRDDHTTDVTTSAIPDPETDENLHMWEATPQGAVLRTVLGVPGAVDIQVVWPEDDGNVCLVVVEARGTDVVVLCERQAGVFAEHQRLNLTKPTKVSAAIHTPPVGSSGLTLAVADPGRTALKGGGISLFQYDKERREFRLLQEEFLEDVVFVEMVSRGTDLLLVAVTEGHRAGLRAGRVCIYRVDWYSLDGLTPLGHRGRLVKSATPSPRVARLPLTPQLFPVQEVPIEAPSEARFLAGPSGGLYLYVISHSGLVTWFSQKGIQMFQKEGEMRVLRRLTLEVWAVAGGEWAPRMSLAGGRCPRGSHEAPNLPTLVLEMMFRGGNATVTTP